MGGSAAYSQRHGGAASIAAAAPTQAAAQTAAATTANIQQLIAQARQDPTAILSMSDDDAEQVVRTLSTESNIKQGTDNDTEVQRYFNAIGWSEERPEVLHESEFQARAKSATDGPAFGEIMYHTDADRGGTKGEAYNRQYLYGPMFFSRGWHGDGAYWANATGNNGRKNGAEHSAIYGDSQIHGFFNKNARAISETDLITQIKSIHTRMPKLFARVNSIQSQSTNRAWTSKGVGIKDGTISVWASMLGYNAIYVDLGATRQGDRGYYVCLNKKAMTVSRVRKPAGPITSNW